MVGKILGFSYEISFSCVTVLFVYPAGQDILIEMSLHYVETL